MKRSAILAACGVLIFAIGCSQNDQSASNTTSSNNPAATTGTANNAAPNTQPTTAANASGYAAVQDIFNTSCMPCHSARNHRAGLDLTSYEAASKGGEHGVPVKPGDPDHSLVIQYLTGEKKPRMPQNRAPLTEDQMKVIKDWIQAGAKNS